MSKKDSLPTKHSATNAASKSREDNSVVETKGNSTKTGEEESINIVSNHR